jgi:signal transduction histidine kinase
MLGRVARDIHEPLSQIRNAVRFVNEQYLMGDADCRRLMSSTERAADQVARKIRDALDLTEALAGRLETAFEVVSAREIVAATANLCRRAWSESDLNVRTNCDPEDFEFVGDPDLLLRTLANLVMLSPRAGSSRIVQVDCLSGPDTVRFVVTDVDGASACDESIELLFCREAVRAMGGKLEEEPEIGRFSLSIVRHPVTGY